MTRTDTSTRRYYRPIICAENPSGPQGFPLAGGWARFDRAEVLTRQGNQGVVAADSLPAEILNDLTVPRPALAGLTFTEPRLMGILNVTPDSFSDGGLFDQPAVAARHAKHMHESGADIIDIGGESTRPGADDVNALEELARTIPVIRYLKNNLDVPISIDTRRSDVARQALRAGADLVNDVSGFDYDKDMASVVAQQDAPACLMHAQGQPKTMQQDPRYVNVLLDVYDALEQRRDRAFSAGIDPNRVILDPGIGFGKTLAHNLSLLRGISLFHGLGCPILVGASRKAFIGSIGGADRAKDRAPGSIAVALEMVKQGVQVLRVHDVAETRQALSLQMALTGQQKQETGK